MVKKRKKKDEEEIGFRLSYKYEIFPTKEQIYYFNLNFRCCQYVFNRFLHERDIAYKRTKEYFDQPVRDENGKIVYDEDGNKVVEKVKNDLYDPEAKPLSYFQTTKMLTKLKKAAKNENGELFLKQADSTALIYALSHLESAFQHFFDRVKKQKQGKLKKGEKLGYPRYKSRKKNPQRSFTTNCNIKNLQIDGNYFKMSKIGWVKANFDRPIEGTPVSITISHTPSGRWWASFNVREVMIDALPKKDNEVGITMGINPWVVTSEGEVFDLPEKLKKLDKKLRREQRKLSRRQKGSCSYRNQKLRKARLDEKIANTRRTATHQLTRQLVNDYGYIATREMNTKEMADKKALKKLNIPRCVQKEFNRGNVNSGYFEINRQLEYKARWAGRDFVKISGDTPTAQTCSSCGHVNNFVAKDLHPTWTCEECGAVHNRKYNGAINILEASHNLSNKEDKQSTDS